MSVRSRTHLHFLAYSRPRVRMRKAERGSSSSVKRFIRTKCLVNAVVRKVENGTAGIWFGDKSRVSPISSRPPQERNTYALHGVLIAERLKAVHNPSRQWHHMQDKGRRKPVRA